MLRLCLILIAIVLSGCATRPASHNFPDTSLPNQLLTERHYEIWVDADGTLFPDGWDALCGSHRSGAYTLHNRALSPNYPECTPELLSQTREQTLSEVAQAFRGLEMVTILIHGFNHGVSASQNRVTCAPGAEDVPATSIRCDYGQRRRAIDSIMDGSGQSDPSHGYIDFFWNGLRAQGPTFSIRGLIGTGTAWTYASINGERAGHLALQPILATLQDAGVQRVHLLAHSRGAAVALAALAGGKYVNDDIRARNASLGAPSPSRPLADTGMEIIVTSTAPAIGQWHFAGGQDAWVRASDPVRQLPQSISSYYSTIYSRDFALRKMVGSIFVRRFNSTAFGQSFDTAARVAARMNADRVNATGDPYFIVMPVDPARGQSTSSGPVRRGTHDATDYLNTCEVTARLAQIYRASHQVCPN
ncbi:hypothetical protein L2D00_10275 [Hyphomonadaceae bacterium BL14]|nr:hypothetical protein L2D00_10275 [Hyphomonadaceae bacterium BL14]